ncbi:MAG: DivIVA domain-containing protein [Solirubrobacteraceae bacterium]
MPDQSSAADERAILQELTAPLTALPDDPVAIVADVDFPVVLRGYDRVTVDAYVKRTSQLVADLQATRSPEAAMRRVTERMGEQISGIIQRAYDTAAQITAQARAEAEDMLEVARQEAAQIVAGGERRLKDLDDDTDRIWAERLRIMEETRALIGQLSAVVQSAAERFRPDEPEVTAEPEAAEPELGAGPRSVAALSAAPEDDAAEGDVTAIPRPVGATREVLPSLEEEPPATR